MNNKLCEAVDDIECIIINTFNEYNLNNENFSIDSYYKENDRLNRPAVSKERCLEDRKGMIDVLARYYNEWKNEKDNFVTLFAIYCNIYIRYNLHQVLPEKDFGLSVFFEEIDDYKIREYLDLIQNGIYNQDIFYFKKAHEKNDKYSVANIYLFEYYLRDYSVSEYQKESDSKKQREIKDFFSPLFGDVKKCSILDDNEDIIYKILEYFDNISDDLQSYILGNDNIFKSCFCFDKEPLPYLKVFNNEIEFQDFILKNSVKYFDKFKYLSEQESFESKNKKYEDINSYISEVVKKIEEFDYNDENLKEKYLNSDILEDRLLYLGIPCIIFKSKYYVSLLLKQSKLYKKISDTEKEKNSIIKDFSHKYKNMKATTLHDIGNTLLKSEDKYYREYGQKVLVEYVLKESLTKDVYMMQLMFEQDKVKLYEKLKDSLLSYTDSSKKNIRDVINTALVFCFINVFYNNDSKFKYMRENVELLKDNIDDVIKDFQENVIFKGKDCINWLLDNGISCNLILSESDDWNRISLKSEDYAFIYLKDIFQELFLNFLNYGNLEKPMILKLYSKEEQFVIYTENYLFDEDENIQIGLRSSSTGLKSFANILPMLYEEDIPIEKYFRSSKRQDIFSLEIEMPIKRFILD